MIGSVGADHDVVRRHDRVAVDDVSVQRPRSRQRGEPVCLQPSRERHHAGAGKRRESRAERRLVDDDRHASGAEHAGRPSRPLRRASSPA